MRQRKLGLVAALGCALGFAVVYSLSHDSTALRHWDARALQRLVAEDHGAIGSAAATIVQLGDPLPQIVLGALACGIALVRRRPLLALAALVVVAGSSLSTRGLKSLLAGYRYESILGLHQIGPEAFPSGHATAMAATAFVFALVAPPRWRLPALAVGVVLLLAVGTAVVVLHDHYPSDVVAGILVAGFWAAATVTAIVWPRSGPRALRG